MQAVILAAGKSTRTYPLTITRPKPLLKVSNKSLLGHNLDNLNNIVDEVIIIVGYKKEMIKKYFENKYKNIRIKYIEQKQQLGTGHAALLAEPYIKDRFILMAGDDIYSKEDISNCIKHRYSILTSKSKNARDFGVVLEKNGILVDFIEKPKKFISDLINTSFYTFDRKIFYYLQRIKKSERNEYELPDAIKLLSHKENICCVKSKQWFPIVYAWDLLSADNLLRKNRSIIGKNTKIYNKIINSTIGNNCIIRGKIINSIIMDNSVIENNSIVEDSVIGQSVHFSGKIKSKTDAISIIGHKKVKVKKLGSIIGDNVKANNVIVNAGCKIWPNISISDKVIEKDLI